MVFQSRAVCPPQLVISLSCFTRLLEMNLCDDVRLALKHVANSSAVSDECFGKLLEACVTSFLANESSRRVSLPVSTKPGVMKGAYASLLSFLIEASRHNMDREVLFGMLAKEYNFPPDRAEKVVKFYSVNKNEVQASLSLVGNCYPHIVDANWTFDMCLKENSVERVGTFFYLIQIRSEICDGTSGFKKTVKKIKFLCTVEELQDFVGKLKDAVKHVERLATT